MRRGGFFLCLSLLAEGIVPETDFYPILEYWRAGDFRANPLCEGPNAPEVPEKVQDYPSRLSTGLKVFSRELLRTYDNVVKSSSLKDLSYAASQRRRISDWNALTFNPMAQAVIGARSQQTDFRGYKDLFCDNIKNAKPEEFCMAMGNFSSSIQCLNLYEYQDPYYVLGRLGRDRDYGFSSVPEECLRAVSTGHQALDLRWELFTHTPDVIAHPTVMAEGRSYYLLHKAVDHLQRYAENQYLTALLQMRSGNAKEAAQQTPVSDETIGIHNLFTNTDVPEYLIPEWKTERVFMMNEPRFMGGPTLRLPYAVLSSRNNDLLLTMRRPATTYEARLALYNQHSFRYLFNFTGEVHDGASTIFQSLSGVLELALQDFYAGKTITPASPTRVTIVGADLPASGAAVILATHVERVLEDKFGGSAAARVAAITFGAPFVSDNVFARYASQKIEVRNIMVQGDSIDLFPCAITYSCDERVLLPRTGIETGKLYNYAPMPGQVRISFADLAGLNAAWGSETSRLQLAATRDCAYQCYLASRFCQADTQTKCSPNECEAWL